MLEEPSLLYYFPIAGSEKKYVHAFLQSISAKWNK